MTTPAAEALAHVLFRWNTPEDPYFVINGRVGEVSEEDPYLPIARAALIAIAHGQVPGVVVGRTDVPPGAAETPAGGRAPVDGVAPGGSEPTSPPAGLTDDERATLQPCDHRCYECRWTLDGAVEQIIAARLDGLIDAIEGTFLGQLPSKALSYCAQEDVNAGLDALREQFLGRDDRG